MRQVYWRLWTDTSTVLKITHYNAQESNDYIKYSKYNKRSTSEKINKIKLPDKNFDLTKNYTAAVSGYGKTGATEVLSQYLKRAELSIIITD